jgi:hypothetical protein
MVRALTLMAVFAALAVAGCGGSKNSSTGAKDASTGPKGASTATTDAGSPAGPADAAAIRGVLNDMQRAAVAGDASTICTRIFTHKFAVKLKSTETGSSCSRVVRRGFKGTKKLTVLSLKTTDAANGTAKIRDGLGVRGTVVLVKQNGRWRIADATTP